MNAIKSLPELAASTERLASKKSEKYQETMNVLRKKFDSTAILQSYLAWHYQTIRLRPNFIGRSFVSTAAA